MDRRPGVTDARLYDDFVPNSEWVQQPTFESLVLHLPGFTKDQLKVQVTSTRRMRVMGERPLGANKFRRFRKEFPVPSNCISDRIIAKFENDNLILEFPKTLNQQQPLPPRQHQQQYIPKPQIKPKDDQQKNVNEKKPRSSNEPRLGQLFKDQETPTTKTTVDKTWANKTGQDVSKETLETKERGWYKDSSTDATEIVSEPSNKENTQVVANDKTNAGEKQTNVVDSAQDAAKATKITNGLKNMKQIIDSSAMKLKTTPKKLLSLVMVLLLILGLGFYTRNAVLECTLKYEE